MSERPSRGGPTMLLHRRQSRLFRLVYDQLLMLVFGPSCAGLGYMLTDVKDAQPLSVISELHQA
jgi:hypothetical protein